MFRNFVLLLIIIFSVLLVFLVSTLFAHTFETFHVLPTAFALRVAHCFSWSCLLLRVLCCTRCGKQRVSIFHIYLKVTVVVNFLLWFFFFFLVPLSTALDTVWPLSCALMLLLNCRRSIWALFVLRHAALLL